MGCHALWGMAVLCNTTGTAVSLSTHFQSESAGTPLQLDKSWEISLVLSALANKKCEASPPLLAEISERFGSTEFSKERNGPRKKLIQIFDSLLKLSSLSDRSSLSLSQPSAEGSA